jgi:Domain of unknown function (DUF4202)
MTSDQLRFDKAIERFDQAHAEDPESELADGTPHPKELLYAMRMTAWLQSLAPDASEPLKLAARCQHICRWSIPRSMFPTDVNGYRQWRAEEARAHAETAARILEDVGYEEATIRRVQALVRKEGLKRDPEVQQLEDVACIVFLDSYFAGFADKHDDETLIRVVRKTWTKLSTNGRDVALGLKLPARLRSIVERAVATT